TAIVSDAGVEVVDAFLGIASERRAVVSLDEQHEEAEVAAEVVGAWRARGSDVIAHRIALAFDGDDAAVRFERRVVLADFLQQREAEAGIALRIHEAPYRRAGWVVLGVELAVRIGIAVAHAQAHCVVHVAHCRLPDRKRPAGGGLKSPRPGRMKPHHWPPVTDLTPP